MDEGDDGARVGLWVALGIITLLLFGVIGGLAMRQAHKKPAAAPAVATAAAGDTLIDGAIAGDLLGKVYFDTGLSALPADAAATVAAAKAALAAAPAGSKLVLSGFHDATGDPARNAELAKERAKAVRAALVAAGVDATRLALRKPESTTGSGDEREARRVEVRVLP